MRVLHSDLEKAQRKAGQHRHQVRHQHHRHHVPGAEINKQDEIPDDEERERIFAMLML